MSRTIAQCCVHKKSRYKCVQGCIALAAVLFFTGCGAETDMSGLLEDEQPVALIQPVEEEELWEAAAYRSLFDAEVYQGSIYPDIQEYSFPIDVVFDRYEVMQGNHVKKGDILVYANTESIDADIESLEERLKTMEEQQRKSSERLEEELYEPEAEAKRLYDIVKAYEEAEPEKYHGGENAEGSVSGGDAGDNEPEGQEISKEYLKWEEEYKMFEGQYRILALQNDTARQNFSQQTQLYELEHAYILEQINDLKKEREQYVIKAAMDGEVVALKFQEAERVSAENTGRQVTVPPLGPIKAGTVLSRGTAVAAVGSQGGKLVKSPYIRTSYMEQAQEVYAYINGIRYEVAHVEGGDANYSVFELLGEGEQVMVGDSVFIVVVNRSRRNVLTVPQEAISGENGGYSVYVRQESGYSQIPVTVGMTDGVYTEILSGLSPGDEVLVSNVTTAGSKRQVLESGSPEYIKECEGQLFFPSFYSVQNPISCGAVCFVEYKVNLYEMVKAGDVIASVRVQIDDADLMEKQMKLDRLKARLADLAAKGEKENKYTIEQRQEEIRLLEEELEEMRQALSVTAITAEKSGIVLQLMPYEEGDVLQEGEAIAEIVDAEDAYVIVSGAEQTVRYGEEGISVSYYPDYYDGNAALKETSGTIVSLSAGGLSEGLDSEFVLLKISPEDRDAVIDSVLNMGEWLVESQMLPNGMMRPEIMLRGNFHVMMPTEGVKNVVMVPSSAVKMRSGKPYVMVVQEDGSIVAQSFIPGGIGNGYYWVIDGLEEGMEICLE